MERIEPKSLFSSRRSGLFEATNGCSEVMNNAGKCERRK